jgi:LysR family transcriptional regulator, low CO2-responsive transcriptional regulator
MQVPSHVEYERAASVEHALALLGRPDHRVLAGGHSLIPMMKLRLAQPETLIDINGLAELSYIRVADVAISSDLTGDPALGVVTEPIFRYRLAVVTAKQAALRGNARQWRWLVDPSGTDPGSDTGQLLTSLGVPEDRIGVFPNQGAAWAAAADGAGVAPAVEHLVAQQLRRGELSLVELPGLPMEACWHVTVLERQSRSNVASALRRFLSTPEAMHLMRSPAAGVPPSRFRPPVYVTIWS